MHCIHLNRNLPVIEIQKRVGKENISVTQGYLQFLGVTVHGFMPQRSKGHVSNYNF
jgi:hypothetical protein